jgi:bacteriocin-like protein
MKKLSKEEMKTVKGGTNGLLYTCNYSPGGAFYPFPFCHNGNPADHTDSSCSDVYSCIPGASCANATYCP